jgi:hypothetical protein
MKFDKYHYLTITDEDGHTFTELHGHNLCDEACGCDCGNTAGEVETHDGCSGFPPGK